MASRTKADWNLIRTEYVTTQISYRQLAKKHDVNERTLMRWASKEKWADQRAKYNESVCVGMVEQVMTADIDKSVDNLSKLRTAADKMADVIDGVMSDSDQFRRHLIRGTFGAKEERFNKADTKAIKEMTAAMRDLAALLRDLYNLPTVQEQSAMDIALERLRLDQAKSGVGEEDDGGGVVEIAEVVDE